MKKSNHRRRLSGFVLSPVLLISACSQQSANVKQQSSDNDFFFPPILSRESGDRTYSYNHLFGSNIPKQDSLPQDHDNIWGRLFDLYRLPDVENSRVQREMKWFLAHPDYLQRVQERAEPYLYTIIEELESNGIPGEIALLPVVESAFRPYAYSRADAAGLWQFIPATGRLYGLEQNWWYDGRRDVYASTKAAARYLKKLENDFDGDWLLALAAYNSGEGTVSRAIESNLQGNLPADYWSLDLPRETEAYVPRLIAISKIFANADEHGIQLRPIPNEAPIAPVNVDGQIDLSVAAELADISLAELFRLNPGFNRNVTAPNGPHRLLLPVEKVDLFKRRLAELAPEQRIVTVQHRVSPGETLSLLATRYRTSVAALRRANDLSSATIRVGQTLTIPGNGTAAERVAVGEERKAFLLSQQKRSARRQVQAAKLVHTVSRGETLSQIARRYGVNTRQVAGWNRMNTRDVLRVGQRLVLWRKGGGRLAAATPSTIDYTVRKGDSLSVISRRFNVSVADLRKWNAVGNIIKPGQIIKVQVASASTEEG